MSDIEDPDLLPPQEPLDLMPEGVSTIAVIPPPSPLALTEQQPTQIALPKSKELEVLHDDIRKMMRDMSEETAERWDKIKAIDDVNDILRTNIYQFQTMLHNQLSACDRIRKECIEAMKPMKDLGNIDPRDQARTENSHARLTRSYNDRLRQADQTSIELGRLVKEVAREYREFALSKRSAVHISQVEKFALLVKAIIHQEIHDPELLRKISVNLSEGFRKVFPSSVDGV